MFTTILLSQLLIFAMLGALWFFFSARRLNKKIQMLRRMTERSTGLAQNTQIKCLELKSQLLAANQALKDNHKSAPAPANTAKQEFDLARHIEASLLLNEERISSLNGEIGAFNPSGDSNVNTAILRDWYLRAELAAYYEKDDQTAFWETLSSKLAIVFEMLGDSQARADDSNMAMDTESNPDLESKLAAAERCIEQVKQDWNQTQAQVSQAYDALFAMTDAIEARTQAHEHLNLIYQAGNTALKHIDGVTLAFITTIANASTDQEPLDESPSEPFDELSESLERIHIAAEETPNESVNQAPSFNESEVREADADKQQTLEADDIVDIGMEVAAVEAADSTSEDLTLDDESETPVTVATTANSEKPITASSSVDLEVPSMEKAEPDTVSTQTSTDLSDSSIADANQEKAVEAGAAGKNTITEEEKDETAAETITPEAKMESSLEPDQAFSDQVLELDPIVGETETDFPSEEIKGLIDTGSESKDTETETETEQSDTAQPQQKEDQKRDAVAKRPDNHTHAAKQEEPEEEELDHASQALLDELFKDN